MTQRTPMVVEMSRVRSEPVRWLWPGLVPLGKLTVLCGDPGLGKSFVTLDMAARAGRGGPWPGDTGATGAPGATGIVPASVVLSGTHPLADEPPVAPETLADEPPVTPTAPNEAAPGGALLLSAEDDPVDTIRPRLEAMGADLDRVVLLAGMQTREGLVDEFDLSRDVHQLAGAITERAGLSLVVIDPVSAFVGATDSYNNAQVRAMLKPLSDVAADTGAAIVLVTHLRKGEGGPAVQRAMGSLAFTAAARQVLVAMRDPADADGRMLCVAKSNVGRDRLSVPYRIEDGRVVYGEPVRASADEIVERRAPPRPAHRPPSPANEHFAGLLRDEIASAGFVEQEDVRRLAEMCGASWNGVRLAQWRESHGLEVLDLDGKKVWTTTD